MDELEELELERFDLEFDEEEDLPFRSLSSLDLLSLDYERS